MLWLKSSHGKKQTNKQTKKPPRKPQTLVLELPQILVLENWVFRKYTQVFISLYMCSVRFDWNWSNRCNLSITLYGFLQQLAKPLDQMFKFTEQDQPPTPNFHQFWGNLKQRWCVRKCMEFWYSHCFFP